MTRAMSILHVYQQMILWIEHHSPGADKFDHTYAGLAIWLGAAVLLRCGLRSMTPIGILVVCEAANETMDRLTLGAWHWPDTLGDVAATFFWPLMIGFLLRRRIVRT